MTAYALLPSKFLLDQLSDLSSDGKRVLNKRLLLVKENPFRNKRIHFSKLLLFRIRFSDSGKELRLVYLVDGNVVKLLFILDRDKGYDSLEKYLNKVDLI